VEGNVDASAFVSRRIGLDGVNDAFKSMEAGEVTRSVIIY
jgi:Zn-dependent alcohol dehydrogenase